MGQGHLLVSRLIPRSGYGMGTRPSPSLIPRPGYGMGMRPFPFPSLSLIPGPVCNLGMRLSPSHSGEHITWTQGHLPLSLCRRWVKYLNMILYKNQSVHYTHTHTHMLILHRSGAPPTPATPTSAPTDWNMTAHGLPKKTSPKDQRTLKP